MRESGPTSGPSGRAVQRQLPVPLTRARAQWPLLVTVTLGLVVSGTLAALCALLATAGVAGGLAARWQTSGEAAAVSASVLVRDDAGASGPAALATLGDLVTDATGDLAGPVSTWAVSPLSYLPGRDPRATYLLDADTAADHAELDDGRWPASSSGAAGGADGTDPLEVALLRPTADALAVGVGDELVLAPHTGREPDGGEGARRAVVVGIAGRDLDPQWSRDLLGGDGTGIVLGRVDAFGPLLVAPGTLLDAGAPVVRGSVRVVPDLARDPARAEGTAAAVASLRTRADETLAQALGEDVRSVTVQSGVGQEVRAGLAEQGVTRSLVLALLLVVVAVAATVLAQVGRALATRRRSEWELARARGATRRQVGRGTAGEALAAAVVAALAATALGPLLYAALARAPWWPTTTGVGAVVVSPAVLAAVAVGTLLPASAVVLEASRATGGSVGAGGATAPARPAVRVGGEVLLVVVAAVGVVQLRAHAPGVGLDPLLVLAPVAVVAALVVVALRVVPLLARAADGVVHRLRGAVLPVTVWRIARGAVGGAAAAVVWAAATVAFAVPVAATWSQSRVDQAQAAAGADLVIADDAGADTAVEIAEATGASPAAVLDRPVQLGSRPGSSQLVAIDADRADEVVLGRLDDGRTWSELMAPLAEEADAAAPRPEVTAPLGVTVRGEAGGVDGYTAEVTLTLVVQAPSGERTLATTDPVPLDGAPHHPAVALDGPLPDGATVPAAALAVNLTAESLDVPFLGEGATATVAVEIDGAPASAAAPWAATYRGEAQGVRATVEGSAIVATADASVLLDPRARVLLTSYPPPADVPVLASAALANDLGLTDGDLLDLRIGAAAVPARVAGVVPYVPAQPDAPTLLADRSAIADAMLVAGESGPVVDDWWVAQPRADAVERLAAVGLVPSTPQRADPADAATSPLSTPVLAALALLGAGAVVLAWSAVGADATATARAQAIVDARLRALGATRADVRRMALARIVGTTLAAVVTGAAAGTVAALAVAPWIVAGDGGARPVPDVRLVVPVLATLGGLALLAVGAGIVGVVLGSRRTRASTATLLRSGDAA